ncbi:MAG: DUF2815 family protein [Oscillospiraceae bacterium]|nr:DUF2815 family protein [Oscillospiraceae bacterium]
METKLKTDVVVLDFQRLFELEHEDEMVPVYEISVIFSKENAEMITAINNAIDAAVERGTLSAMERSILELPLKCGNIEHPYNLLYANSMFFTASVNVTPYIVDSNFNPIPRDTLLDGVYYAKVLMEFVPIAYDEAIIVSCMLHHVQILDRTVRLNELRSYQKHVFEDEKVSNKQIRA